MVKVDLSGKRSDPSAEALLQDYANDDEVARLHRAAEALKKFVPFDGKFDLDAAESYKLLKGEARKVKREESLKKAEQFRDWLKLPASRRAVVLPPYIIEERKEKLKVIQERAREIYEGNLRREVEAKRKARALILERERKIIEEKVALERERRSLLHNLNLLLELFQARTAFAERIQERRAKLCSIRMICFYPLMRPSHCGEGLVRGMTSYCGRSEVSGDLEDLINGGGFCSEDIHSFPCLFRDGELLDLSHERSLWEEILVSPRGSGQIEAIYNSDGPFCRRCSIIENCLVDIWAVEKNWRERKESYFEECRQFEELLC